MKLPRLTLAAVALSLASCQVHTRGFVDAITPETVAVGVTVPNAGTGPVVTSKGGDHERQPLGQIGLTATATYRLKPIRIEREPAPTPTPRALFTPFPSPVATGTR